jgi:hypothetical protein
MSKPRMTLVITTINVPHLLEGYADNFAKYNHLGEVDAIIVGDRKTPHAECKQLAQRLTGRGFKTAYLDLPEQEKYLDRFPSFKPLVPYNSDNRRNIGYLMAAEQGADILAAVDDDNFVMDDDWYAGHAHLGKRQSFKTVTPPNGWFNPCGLIDYDPPRTIYARGYPYNKRWTPNESAAATSEGRPVMNGGMWLREPDVDSLTRLSQPVAGVRVNETCVMLARGVMAPINTQNTTFHRDVVPAFYFVPVGDPIGGVACDRYGDIWAGFFAEKVIAHLDDRVTFGEPACDHRRNVHRLLQDLEVEMWSVVLTDQLADHLAGWTLTGKTYGEAYVELAGLLEKAEWKHRTHAAAMKAFFGRMAHAMHVWVDVCRQIGCK